MDVGTFYDISGSDELARNATAESAALLVEALGQIQGLGPPAGLFAAGVEQHASAIDDAGRPELAQPLYAAIWPLFEQFTSPEIQAKGANNHAFVLRRLSRHAEAATWYGRAADTLTRLVAGGRDDLADFWIQARGDQALAHREAGDVPATIAAFDRVIEGLSGLIRGGRADLADQQVRALISKGGLQKDQSDLAGAALTFARAVAVCRACPAGDPERLSGLALVLFSCGTDLFGRGEQEAAVSAYTSGIEALTDGTQRGGGDGGLDLARLLVNRGAALRSLGRLTEASDDLRRAVSVLRPLAREGHPELVILLPAALTNLGNLWFQRGEHQQAIHSFDEAIDWGARLGTSPRDIALAALAKGSALARLGRIAESLAALDLAAESFQDLTGADEQTSLTWGRIGGNRAAILLDQGNFVEAATHAAQAAEVLSRLVESGRADLANDLAAAHMNRGVALYQIGRNEEALQSLDRAIEIRQRLVDGGRADLAGDLATVLMNRGSVLSSLDRNEEALADYDRSIALRRVLVEGDRPDLAGELTKAQMNKASLLADLGRYEEASALFGQVRPELIAPSDRVKCFAMLADQRTRQGHRDEALQLLARTREALRLARGLAHVDETALEYAATREWVIARAVRQYLEAEETGEAFLAIQEGKAAVLGDVRNRLERGNVIGDSAELLAARANLTRWLAASRPDDPPSPAERRSRAAEYLRLWHRGRHPVATTAPASLPPEAADLRAVCSSVPSGWAILDFWWVDGAVHVFVVTRDGLSRENCSFPLEEMKANLDAFIRAAATPLSGGDLSALGDLHAYLFAPLLPSLRERNISGLYLVPHGALHLLPLHAARSPEGVYLCDEFDVAYLPSSAMLPRLPAPRTDGPLFSLANPERGTPHELPFAEWEGEQIERRFRARGGAFLRGPDAGLAQTGRWGDAALVHFSGHGVGDESFAPLSHLRLADDLLLAHDVAHRCPALREGAVVVLNGCQTAVRDARAFDESMGLMTAFLLRGASFVLATQWSVEDRCAAEFVLAFLDQLLDRGASPTQAMRHAQRIVRRLPDDAPAGPGRGMTPLGPTAETRTEAEVSPLLWGAFQLVGRVT